MSNLFISKKKVTVVYQLTIHFGFSTSLRDPLPLIFFHSIVLPPSSIERASEAVLPIYCNYTSSFLSFPHFLSQSNIHGLLHPSSFFFSFSLSNILSCFLLLLSRHFILTFQKRGALSPGENVSIVHNMLGLFLYSSLRMRVCMCYPAFIQECV